MWLVSSDGRVLARLARGPGFESRSGHDFSSAETVVPDPTQRSASELGLYCFPMSPKRYSGLQSVKNSKRNNQRIHSRKIKTLHFFPSKIHGLLFKVLDRDNKPSCFQETLTNSTKHCLEYL